MGVVEKNIINSKSSAGFRLAQKCKDIKTQLYQIYSFEKYDNQSLISFLGVMNGGNDALAEVDCRISNQKNYKLSIYANSGLSKRISSSNSIPIAYVPNQESRVFEQYTIRTTPKRDINSGSIPRIHDSEYKLLEYIARGLEFNSAAYGEINLYTKLQPCLSCDIVFVNFTRMFPNIKIAVYYEKEYNTLTRGEGMI